MQQKRASSESKGGNSLAGPLALSLLVWAGSLKETPLFAWFPVDLTLAMSVVVALAIADSHFRGGPPTKRVAAPLLVLLTLVPAVAIVHIPPAYSVSKVTTLFTITLLLAVAPFYLLRSGRQRQVFSVGIVAFGVLAAGNLVFLPTEVENSPGRFALEGSNTIAVARIVLAAAVVLLVAATIRGLALRGRLLTILLAVALTSAATLTGSRGPLLAMFVAIGVTVAAAAVYRKYRARASLAIVAIVLVGGWYLLRSSETEGLARIVGTLTGETGSTPDSRVMIWSHALELFFAEPFGRGWGTFSFAGLTYPHNLLLEVAVEAGVVVLAIAIILLVTTLHRGARAAVDWQTSVIFGLFIFALANAMVSSDINGNRLLWVTGFAIWAASSESSPGAHRPDGQSSSTVTPDYGPAKTAPASSLKDKP